ncbi:MAG: N-(5'-phosphoribosyl)anthranilate isomerase [Bryobacteraceae bacterium]
MMVKICGITNPEDALAAVAGGASAVGFNFYPASPRYIEPELAARISEALPPAVLRVGVFVNAPREVIFRIQEIAGIHVAQLHGDEAPDTVPKGIRVWKALRVNGGFGSASMEPYKVEAFLLDAPSDVYGGSGRIFDWSKACGARHRIVLAGGLDESNVGEAIRLVRPWGVDACSRLESAPGRKDHTRLASFLKAALAEEAR